MVRRLIKLGGSVVTRRGDSPFSADSTARIAREVYRRGEGLVLVHGTGHVGKPFAITHDFLRDGLIPATRPELAREIKLALLQLNRDVVACLRDAGVPAEGIEPSTCFTAELEPVDETALCRQLDDMLDSDRVPVLHGDLVPLADGGQRVFSSDVIMEHLGRMLRPELALFLSDVDGVFASEDQGRPATEPISRLHRDNSATVHRAPSDRMDVSGGMSAKLDIAFRLAASARRCVIANGLEPGVAAAVVDDRPVACTRVIAA